MPDTSAFTLGLFDNTALSSWNHHTLQGATGYWFACTAGLLISGVALAAFMAWMLKQPGRLQV